MKAYRIRLMVRFLWPICLEAHTVNSKLPPDDFLHLVDFITHAAEGAPWVGGLVSKAIQMGCYITCDEIK